MDYLFIIDHWDQVRKVVFGVMLIRIYPRMEIMDKEKLVGIKLPFIIEIT